jgi:hypothetical protein
MGFQKPDLGQAARAIQSSLSEIRSPYNDGWISQACKKELYQLKCWLEDEYARLPTFFEEKEWEKERIVQRLKQKEKS